MRPVTPRPRLQAGERRHLTVLFCDIVNSTRLAEQFDPEDWVDIVAEFQQSSVDVVRRFGGHVAEQLGDGLVAYFGWPVAHEDDAYRAVRTGLGLLDSVSALERRQRIGLQIRVGIHTGPVIVSGAGRGQKDDYATGSALHVGSRLQGIAEPDTVVISAATFDLVRGYFTCEDLGLKPLRNVAKEVNVYRVTAESGVANRLDAVTKRGLTPFLGRESEVNKLLALWERVLAGSSEVAEISGEPGIGKSRLVRMISERVSNAIVVRCSEIDSSSALFPVISRLSRLLAFDQCEEPGQKLDRLEHRLERLGFSTSEVVPLLASEFSLPLLRRYPPSDLPVQKKRQQTFAVLVEWILREAAQQPLMLVWEDLHWADPSTIELIGLLIERVADGKTPLFTVLTFRPEFQPPWPAAASLTTLALRRLERPVVEEMITTIAEGRFLPVEVVEEIVEKTDGVPLFVEELVRTVLESGIVRLEDNHYVIAKPSSPIAIPTTLEGSLMSRLDRLGAAKAIAQRAAVLGRAFSQDLMRAALMTGAETDAERAGTWRHAQQCLTELVEAGVLRRRRARQTTYEFKHALIQDAAYESLLRRDRRAFHLQTARVLEAEFAQTSETQPELVAHHYTHALDFEPGTGKVRSAFEAEQAVDYWLRAGERARDRSANKEAVRHFTQGLKVLDGLPEGEARDRRELMLRIAGITPVIAVQGYVAEANVRSAERARALCRKLGDVDRLFPVLYQLWVNFLVGARYADAARMSEEFFREAADQPDAAPLLVGHRLRGFSLFMAGDLMAAEDHLRHSLKLYDRRRHVELKNQGYGQDPRCSCEAFMAIVRWLRGYGDDASVWSRAAIEHAKEARHSNTWGYVVCWGGASFEAFRGDADRFDEYASELSTFSEKQGLPVWLAYATVLRGWSLAQRGHLEDGIAEMKTGLVHFEDVSSKTAPPNSLHMGFMKSFLLSLLGEACRRLWRFDEAGAHLDAALSFADGTGEAFWKPEIIRLKGELLLDQGQRQDAETFFLKARDIAAQQGARSLELRAVMSLCRLWRLEKPAEASRMLAEVYGGFTEGFDSQDLRAARDILSELAEAQELNA